MKVKSLVDQGVAMRFGTVASSTHNQAHKDAKTFADAKPCKYACKTIDLLGDLLSQSDPRERSS
eukprot:2950301-Pleurochrysis_carterae.AAC.5